MDDLNDDDDALLAVLGLCLRKLGGELAFSVDDFDDLDGASVEVDTSGEEVVVRLVT
jgi:hypothetical protein